MKGIKKSLAAAGTPIRVSIAPAFQSDAVSPLWCERVNVGLFGAIEGRAHLGEKIALLSCKGCRNFEGIALFKGQGNGERPFSPQLLWVVFL